MMAVDVSTRYPNGTPVTWQSWTSHITGRLRHRTDAGTVIDYRGPYAVIRRADTHERVDVRHDRLTVAHD